MLTWQRISCGVASACHQPLVDTRLADPYMQLVDRTSIWNVFVATVQLLHVGSFDPLTLQAEGVLSLPATVRRPSVRPQTLLCPHDNSSEFWAGITKCAPNIHHGTLSVSIEQRGHWPRPSRSFWSFGLRILGNSTCLCDNWSQIWAKITKFVPNMEYFLSVLKINIIFLDLQRSLWLFLLLIPGNLTCPRDYLKWIWAGITKFAPNMHLGILSAGIENDGHGSWLSMSFCQFDSGNGIPWSRRPMGLTRRERAFVK